MACFIILYTKTYHISRRVAVKDLARGALLEQWGVYTVHKQEGLDQLIRYLMCVCVVCGDDDAYYTVLYYTILDYIIHYTILYDTILYTTIPYATILCYTIHYYTLHYTTLYSTCLSYLVAAVILGQQREDAGGLGLHRGQVAGIV
jgi:hypothetical protein